MDQPAPVPPRSLLKAVRPVNPWLSIWFHPRRTVRHIIETQPTYGVALIAAVVGMLQSVAWFLEVAEMGRVPLNPTTLGFAVFSGVLIGIIVLYLLSALYRLSGSWFGGQADNEDVRAAVSWPLVPMLLSYAVWFLLFYKENIGFESFAIPDQIVYSSVVSFVSLWSLLLACHTIGEVHGFSAWKGFFTLFFGNLFLLVPIVVLVFLVSLPRITPVIQRSGKEKLVATGYPQKAKKSSPSPAVTTPTFSGTPVEIVGVSETDLDLYRRSGKVMRIRLKKNGEIRASILDFDKEFLYVDTFTGMLNIPRDQVESIDIQ